jgi:hypothetical protein
MASQVVAYAVPRHRMVSRASTRLVYVLQGGLSVIW